jgi:hypothetical protein
MAASQGFSCRARHLDEAVLKMEARLTRTSLSTGASSPDVPEMLIMLSFYGAMLVDAEQNWPAARWKLAIPALVRGGSLLIGNRNESQMRLMGPRHHRSRPPGRTPAVKWEGSAPITL